jgi:hypothetical protein
MKMNKLNLYVWENSLSDYSSGIAFAFAESEDEAWEQLYKTDIRAWFWLNGNGQLNHNSGPISHHAKLIKEGKHFESNAVRPKIIKRRVAYAVWGASG